MPSPTLLSTQPGRNIFSFWKMNATTGADKAPVALFQIANFGNSGDFGNLFCVPLPASFSPDTPPPCAFVENKSSTSIRKACRKLVDPSFSRFSGLQSRSISALFSRSNCPVGRGSQRSLLVWLTADLLIFKDHSRMAAPSLGGKCVTLPFVRFHFNKIGTKPADIRCA